MEYQIWNILKYSLYIGRIFYIMVFHNWYIVRHVRSMQIQSRLGHAVLSNPRSGSGYGFAGLTYRSQYNPKQCHRLFDRLNRWLRQERFHMIPREPHLGRVPDGWSVTIGPLFLSWDNCPEMVFGMKTLLEKVAFQNQSCTEQANRLHSENHPPSSAR